MPSMPDIGMCLQCTSQTEYVLCPECYKRARHWLKAVQDMLIAGITLDSGAMRDYHRTRDWCQEHDQRKKAAQH